MWLSSVAAGKMFAYGAVLLLSVLRVQASGGVSNSIYNMDDYRDHPCNRQCEHMAPPRLCKYRFVVENYWTLSKACADCPFNQSDCFRPHCVSTDGVSRGVIVVNRQLPGPAIEVCAGDTIEVEVYNDLQNSEGTSIHWHGILQRGTPHMDGTSMVTQCPITPHSAFTYRFVAENPGTHFWHGHAGMQRADGVFGPLIVRQSVMNEVHHTLYDHDLSEHVIMVNDWRSHMTMTEFVADHHDDGIDGPSLMLINGLGSHESFMKDNDTYYTPKATFTVQGGKRYRFRVISNAVMDCPIQVSVDGHTMMMVASDGNAFEPFTADSFNIFAGERYDFILYADKTATLRNYWIRARGFIVCESANQVALLKYVGAPDVDPPEPTDWASSARGGILLNPFENKGNNTQVEVSRMRAEAPDGNDGVMTSVPDKTFYLAMDFNQIDNFKYQHPDLYPLSFVKLGQRFYTPQINRISSSMPPSPPLSQYDDIPAGEYCNDRTVQQRCDKEWCHCIHKLDVDLGDLVELVMVDEGFTWDAVHPMHIHGFKFRTLAIEKLGTSITMEEVKAMDERGEIHRSLSRAPLKDTVWVPDGGYSIVRFRADNPGVWFFHCHITVHVDVGMNLMFQVGSKSDFPKAPKNFPRCGSWYNDMDDDDDDDDDGGNDKQPILVQCLNAPGNAGVRPVAMHQQMSIIVMMFVTSVLAKVLRIQWY